MVADLLPYVLEGIDQSWPMEELLQRATLISTVFMTICIKEFENYVLRSRRQVSQCYSVSDSNCLAL